MNDLDLPRMQQQSRGHRHDVHRGVQVVAKDRMADFLQVKPQLV